MLAPPGRPRAVILELTEAVRENTSERRCHRTDEIKDSIALLQFVPGIPAAEKVGTA